MLGEELGASAYNRVIKYSTMLKNRCEIVSRHIFPACRSVIMKQLFDKYQFTQTAVAKKLGITQGAISNYLSLKRGKNYINLITEHPQVMAILNDLVDQIAHDIISDEAMHEAFCDICTLMQRARYATKVPLFPHSFTHARRR